VSHGGGRYRTRLETRKAKRCCTSGFTSVDVITDRAAMSIANVPSVSSAAAISRYDDAAPAAPGARPFRRRPVHLISTVVAVVGAAMVASLVWLTGVVNSHTQYRLLHTQAAEAGVVIGEVVPTILTPLTTSTAIADVSHGDVAQVKSYIAPEVGTHAGRLFRSFSLWRLSPTGPTRVMALGERQPLAADPGAMAHAFSKVPGPNQLTVIDLVNRSPPRIGYVVEGLGTPPSYVAFAESAIPPHRRAVIPSSSAFHDLAFALYLGNRPVAKNLIEATTPMPEGTTAHTSIRFGTATIDLVAAARRPLGGGVLPALPWIVGAVGAAIVIAAVVIAEWLMRRRRTAEHLARENLRLYAEQRSISQTLQSALLPKSLPSIPGVDLAARYVPGDAAVDIGGDWYDVIKCDERSFIFAIGDVSGRGIPAANTMASLHYAIRAYAAQGDDPETILDKLTALLDVARDGHFATVLLGHVDVPLHKLTLVNAGHLPPIVMSDGKAHFVAATPGTPIGVAQTVSYVPLTTEVPRRASVLAFTDGLVERRGEFIDTGLNRLLAAVGSEVGAPTQLLDRVAMTLTDHGASDDVAMLAIRWKD
jgi:hypothetical protein